VSAAPRPVQWTEHAALQLAALAEYISVASPVYAEQMVARIDQRLQQAAAFPESGRVVPELGRPDVRELIEPPYRLIYRVQPDAVQVLAVVHGRQEFRALP
jgi:plasmid stabilization system protein ParE